MATWYSQNNLMSPDQDSTWNNFPIISNNIVIKTAKTYFSNLGRDYANTGAKPIFDNMSHRTPFSETH